MVSGLVSRPERQRPPCLNQVDEYFIVGSVFSCTLWAAEALVARPVCMVGNCFACR